MIEWDSRLRKNLCTNLNIWNHAKDVAAALSATAAASAGSVALDVDNLSR